jgi:hypothetical protein
MVWRDKNYKKNRGLGDGKKKFIYSKKTYANPFFRRQKNFAVGPVNSFSKKIKLGAIALIIFSIFIIWFLFFSPVFKINKIVVSGVGENTAKEIEAIAWDKAQNKIFGKNNLLLFSKNELKEALNEKYFLHELKIKKQLWHTLKIDLIEEQQAAVWLEDNKYYYLGSEGDVINEVDPLNINRLAFPIIENLTGVKIDGRQAKIDKPTVDFVLGLFNEFKDQKHSFDIEKFIVDSEIDTVKMQVLAGPKIYFNIKEPVTDQAQRLDLIIKEKLKDTFMAKEYINLKFGNNIYIK